MNSVSGSSLPSELAEKLTKDYQILLRNPKPEEEERIHDEMLQIFRKMVADSTPDSEFRHKCRIIKELLESWDPLDFWFVELPKLPIKIRDFLVEFAQFKPPSEKKEVLTDLTVDILSKKHEIEENLEDLLNDDEETVITPEESQRIDKRIEMLQSRIKKIKRNVSKNGKISPVSIPKTPKPKSESQEFQKDEDPILAAPKIVIPPEKTENIPGRIKRGKKISDIKDLEPKSKEKETHAKVPTNMLEEHSKIQNHDESIPQPTRLISPNRSTQSIQSYTKEEIAAILASEQSVNSGSSLITQVLVKDMKNPQNPDIILKDVFDQANIEENLSILDKTTEAEKLYHELLRFRGKMTHLRLKSEQIQEKFKQGKLVESKYRTFLEQNANQMKELSIKIAQIEKTLFKTSKN